MSRKCRAGVQLDYPFSPALGVGDSVRDRLKARSLQPFQLGGLGTNNLAVFEIGPEGNNGFTIEQQQVTSNNQPNAAGAILGGVQY